MMNVVAICLVVTSLAAAGVWSPSPTASQQDDSVILKGGHRVVVVEYDQDGHPNTKVSISPDTPSKEEPPAHDKAGDHGPGFAAKELICDAYGKCKHIISSTLGKARDEAAAKVHDTKEFASDKARDAQEAFEGAKDRTREAKESVSRKAHDAARETFEAARDKAREAKESVSQKAHGAEERARETLEAARDKAREAKESVSQKAHGAKRRADEQVERMKDAAREAKEDAQTTIGETVRSTSEKAGEVKETAKGRFRSGAHKVKEMGHKLWASQTLAPTSLMRLINLLGFVTAYGMCTWVTFISSYVLAKTLPRQQFALVQSKIYPVYFRAMVYSIGAALLGHLLSQRTRLFSSNPEMLQAYNLLSGLLMVSFNMLYLEPRATKVMFERMKLEKEEGRGREVFGGEERRAQRNESSPAGETPDSATDAAATSTAAAEAALEARVAKLSERMKSLNSHSSLLNILTLVALTWHLVYLSQRLAQAC